MMRGLMLLAVLTVAGCDGSPASLGITGPGTAPAPARAPDDSTIGNPGVPSYGNSYGPSIGPNQSGGRYFNYN